MTKKDDLLTVKLLLGFIAAVIAVYILKLLSSLFIPLTVAMLLYFLLNNTVKKLIALRLPTSLILIILLVFIFVALYLFGLMVYTGASSFVSEFPEYSQRITQLANSTLVRLKIPLKDVESYIAEIDWRRVLNTGRITTIVTSTLGPFTSFMGNLFLVLLYLLFMLGGRKELSSRIRSSQRIDEFHREKLIKTVNSIENKIQRYLRIKTLISLLTAVFGGIILYFGGFDFVIFSALLIFILNYIPTFGSIAATVFPVAMGLIKFGFTPRVILVAAGLMLLQFLMGNVIEPIWTGRSLKLSPILILVSLIFWSWVWGVIGMVLAVPMMSALKIILEQFPTLHTVALFMGSEE